MDLFESRSVKFKFLSFDELVINLDRLSRFKLPDESFNRVFNSIILKCLIYPKFSKSDVEKFNPRIVSNIVRKIWNASVKNCCKNTKISNSSHKALCLIINKTFKNVDERTRILINTKLNISPILSELDFKTSPINLKFLIKVNELTENDVKYENLIKLREKYNLKFPVSRLLIVEGITEEILLPVFADKINMNFDKSGIYILGAGGKSKSPVIYLSVKDKLKIPVVLLFDSDAKEICRNLTNTLDKKDKILMIKEGEFEDILSLNLIKRSLNKEYLPASPIIKDDLHIYNKMCENIENFYKTRHLGEFKKSKLSKIIASNLKYDSDITEEIKNIIFNLI